MDKPQKPQKSRKKPQKSPLPSRKKPQEKPQNLPQLPQTPPTTEPQKAAQVQKSVTSSEDFGIVDTMTGQTPAQMQDLINEAQQAAMEETTAQPTATGQDAPPQETPSAPLAPVPVKETFTDVMSNVWFSALRMGTQVAAKADLSPMTTDQRARLNAVMLDVSQKYIPSYILAMQEEMSLVGVSAEIIMTNIKKQEPAEDGKQDNSSAGA